MREVAAAACSKRTSPVMSANLIKLEKITELAAEWRRRGSLLAG